MKNFASALFLLMALNFAHAIDAPGPHGGKVVANDTHRFEVKINPEDNQIEVFTIENKKKVAPKNMAITLFRESGSGQTVELKAVDLKDPLPKYQGELSPSAGSYVGAELKFGVSPKALNVLKFVPYIPPRAGR